MLAGHMWFLDFELPVNIIFLPYFFVMFLLIFTNYLCNPHMYIFLGCACLSLSQFVIYTIVKCVLLQCSQIMKLFLYILL